MVKGDIILSVCVPFLCFSLIKLKVEAVGSVGCSAECGDDIRNQYILLCET